METVKKVLAPLGNLNDAQRAKAYRVLTALAVLATLYGIVDENEAAAWVAVGTALLGLPAAVVNTSTHPPG